MDNFTAEITKSIKFFQTRYPNLSVKSIYLSGFGAVIPQIDAYVAAKTSIPTQAASPWQRVSMSTEARQQLAPVAAEFAAAVGLAQRSNLA